MGDWSIIREVLIDIVKYGFPTIAIGLSILSYFNSRKSTTNQERINHLEEQIKRYQIEEIEKKKEQEESTLVEARIYKVSNKDYRIKIWNSGGANAYNVNFTAPKEQECIFMKRKSPFEVLEPGKSYEELVMVVMGTPPKVTVTTTWKDDNGVEHSKEHHLQVY
jgi:hypothetical protein